MPLEVILGKLIYELHEEGVETKRTIIYCQTRKRCGVLFRMFEVNLKRRFYHGEKKPGNRLVEMFHAGSPESVKEHVLNDLGCEKGHIRILICTIAFGMGVNCKSVHRVIHFGPAKSLESYVQEAGRAGRDGKHSDCIILYNGLLSTHCSQSMKRYLKNGNLMCLRAMIIAEFGGAPKQYAGVLHDCCDVCAAKCKCGDLECVVKPVISNHVGVKPAEKSHVFRSVTSTDKEKLKELLILYKKKLIEQEAVNVVSTVGVQNIFLEFGWVQILQVEQTCHMLFTIEDVLENVEIWRKSHAIAILDSIAQVFGDIAITHEVSSPAENNINVEMEWEELKNDCRSQCSYIDSQELETLTQTSTESSTPGDDGFFENFTALHEH
jgi:hypothetical protein